MPNELTTPEGSRLARLASVSIALSTAASVAEAAEIVVAGAVTELRAQAGALGLFDPATGLIHLVADLDYPDEARAEYPAPGQSSMPLAEAFARGKPVWIGDRSELEAAYPNLADLDEDWVCGCWLPIEHGGHVIGSVGLMFGHPCTLDEADRSFLSTLISIGAMALAHGSDGLDTPAPEPGSDGVAPATADHAALVLRLGPDARVEHPAPGWCAYTGQSPTECLGRGWLGAIHPQQRAAALDLAGHRMATPDPVGMTLRLRHAASGQWHQARADFVSVTDRSGRLLEVVGAFADVNNRLAAEGQVAGLARLLDSFLTGSPVGFALVDSKLRFQLVNETMAAANGVPSDEHIGRRVAEVAPRMGQVIEPLLQRVLDTEAPILGLELAGQPEGADQEVRDWLVNYFPVRRLDGSLRGVGATLVDITDRNRTEAMVRDLQARQAQDRFRAALDVMRDSVAIDSAIRDESGTIVDFRVDYLNPVVHDLMQRSRDDLVGTTMLESWPQMKGSSLFESYVRTVETGEPFIDNDVRFMDELDGSRVVGYYAIQALRFGDGLLICSRDTTAERESNLRLRETELELAVEHRIVERLQQALLPPSLPTSEHFEVAACYNPVDERADLGGDWYDAFALPDGRVGLSIGDVTGHGLDAAALMAQVRLALRAYALDAAASGDPAMVLDQLDRLLETAGGGEFATAVYAIYDPATGRLDWSRAGHPLPIVCTGDRTTAEVERRGGPPLGSRLIDAYPRCHLVLEPDSFVLFYTDGLVERRGESIDDGVAEVAARLRADDWEGLSPLCDALTDSVREGMHREDDVCILALRRLMA